MNESYTQNTGYTRRGFLGITGAVVGGIVAESLLGYSPKVEAYSPPILEAYGQSPRVRKILWYNSRHEGQCIVNDYIVEDPAFDQYLEQLSLERRVSSGRKGKVNVHGVVTVAIEDEQQEGVYKHLEGIFITAKSGSVITNGIEGKLIASATTGPEGEYGLKFRKRQLPWGKFTLFINYEKDERHNPNYVQAVREFQILSDLEFNVGLIPSDFNRDNQEHLKNAMRGYPDFNATKTWWNNPYPLEVVEVYTGPAFDSLVRPTTQQIDALIGVIENEFRRFLRKYNGGSFEVKEIDATLGTRTPLATPGILMAGFDDSLLKFEKPALGGATRYFLNNGSMIIIGGVAHYITELSPFSLKNVGPHELGHNDGLEHALRKDSVMYPVITPEGVQELDNQTADILHNQGRPPENEADDLNRLKTTKALSV